MLWKILFVTRAISVPCWLDGTNGLKKPKNSRPKQNLVFKTSDNIYYFVVQSQYNKFNTLRYNGHLCLQQASQACVKKGPQVRFLMTAAYSVQFIFP